jgi:hypothetical protein
MRLLQTTLGLVLLAAVVTFTTVGCGSSSTASPAALAPKDFTADDFKKITKDTPEAKVADILGKPADILDLADGKMFFYETKGNYYSVVLKDGKVAQGRAMEDKQEYDLTVKMIKDAKDRTDKARGGK